ncbi:hypothetical protein QUW15_06485 [Desulfovibrio piger]|nr:hypothetical protein [Desulfovibrio piger]
MASRRGENLMPPTSDAARERGTKGGKASAVARRKKRDMRERLEALLAGTRDGMSGADALALALFEKALAGDVKAFETIMATVGDAPRQTVCLPELPEMKTAADLPRLTAAILKAVAEGRISPDEGKKLAELAGVHVKAVEVAELEKRLSEIEKKMEGKK